MVRIRFPPAKSRANSARGHAEFGRYSRVWLCCLHQTVRAPADGCPNYSPRVAPESLRALVTVATLASGRRATGSPS